MATTGLVVGALLNPKASAAGIELALGGLQQQYLGYASSDSDLASGEDDIDGLDVKSNSEIWFVGEAVLDNGLTLGVEVTLEGNTNLDDQIDQSFLYVEGAFGRFNIGSENSAGFLLGYAAPNVGLGVNSTSILTGFLPQYGALAGADFFNAPLGSTYLEIEASDPTDKSEKLTYFTPRLSGFQFGLSYLPDPGEDDNAQAEKAGVAYRNGFSLGGNFVESLDGLELALSGRYDRADDHRAGEDDPRLWAVGVNLGLAGLTLGGSYAEAAGMAGNSGRSFDLGASYQAGFWAASVTYLNGRVLADPAVAGDSRYQAWEGAVSRELGPGITALGSLSYQDLRADTDERVRTWALVGGFSLEF